MNKNDQIHPTRKQLEQMWKEMSFEERLLLSRTLLNLFLNIDRFNKKEDITWKKK